MKIDQLKSVFYTLVALLMLSQLLMAEGITAGTFEENEYFIYVPPNLIEGTRYPLIAAFSPSGDGRGLVKTWSRHADTNLCIIMASKIIKNGMDIPRYLQRFAKLIKERVSVNYPVKADGVIALGTSGGGMAAHLFSFFHPDTVGAVISSVGYIHENSLKSKDTYPRKKVCAFLTSPTDFNYKLMQEDKKFLTSLDWTLRWYEFVGGHRTAPEDVREEALAWVLANMIN